MLTKERVTSSLIKESTKRSESLGPVYRAVNKFSVSLVAYYFRVRMKALLCPSLIAGFSLEHAAVYLCRISHSTGRQAGKLPSLPITLGFM